MRIMIPKKVETIGMLGILTVFVWIIYLSVSIRIHPVGSSIHQELWIPAEELEEFNRNIVDQIEVIAVFST
jgi:hypothetical protein